jgi:formylglycine-generating enzyme required for sulfatase activity
MHGNIFERCLEPYGPYDPGRMSGLAARRDSRDERGDLAYVIRGGGYRYRATFARSAYRWKVNAKTAAPDVGLRPAMALTRAVGD